MKEITTTLDNMDTRKLEKLAERRGVSVEVLTRALIHEAVFEIPLTADDYETEKVPATMTGKCPDAIA